MPLENLLYIYPRQMGYSIGLFYTDTFMVIELNKASNVSLFYKILINHDLVKLPETFLFNSLSLSSSSASPSSS